MIRKVEVHQEKNRFAQSIYFSQSKNCRQWIIDMIREGEVHQEKITICSEHLF